MRIRYGHGRVAFEANRDAILAGLKARKPMTMIYDELKDKLGMPYRTFARHVQNIENERVLYQKAEKIFGLPTSVYIISPEDDCAVKIGMSDNVEKRLAKLQHQRGEALTIRFSLAHIHARIIEGLLHKHFKAFRLGGEWFSISSEYAIPQTISLIEHYDMCFKHGST